MMHPWLLKHSPRKKGVDGFIEFTLGKEQLDNWTLGPDPGPLPKTGPCQEKGEAWGLQLPTREMPIFTPLEGLLGTSNLLRKPRAKVTWAGPEKGIGEVGKQAEAGLGACG